MPILFNSELDVQSKILAELVLPELVKIELVLDVLNNLSMSDLFAGGLGYCEVDPFPA